MSENDKNDYDIILKWLEGPYWGNDFTKMFIELSSQSNQSKEGDKEKSV